MEPNMAEGSSLTAALLSSLLSLGVPPDLGVQVTELYRLQTALMRRRRLREMMERDRRRRQYLRRRRAFLLSSLAGVLSLITTTRRPIWVLNRSPGQNLWSVAEQFDDEEWKSQFRISKATFAFLIEQLRPDIERVRTNFRAPIEPRRRLAIALWWFSRSGEYRAIADLFGVGIATVCLIVRQVTTAILDRMYETYVSLPSGDRLDETIRAFKDRCYPQCAGAIGGTHIPIAAPRENPDDYYNQGGWHSVILQAVVDHELCFTDVYAGWPGSTGMASVLSSSDLYLKAEDRPDGYLFPREKSIMSDGVEIPVHLIGDESFPLKPWLMKGYSQHHQLSAEQRRFTYTLTSARSVVDTAFTRLKGRWRCLLKKREIDVSMMPRVVAACCVLHNMCEQLGDAFLPEWNADINPTAMSLRQPDAEPYHGDEYSTAEVIRDTITYNLLTILQY
ncbi:protein ANTAGONIST OF LIKE HETEROCHROMATIN PROTEIN 1-like isoform X2 [Notolabrus celidotus]|uniref:protein ANTAGONIST OF LIKE HETEROCHROMATIN PROTEIN 1-like isoform X1 n=1 Tax=Notolabrus celidotus TaxID=1203425 RepID=UPI0014906918|nr:protein ANTAGONIST OF LIKE HETEROCHROMATIN PROTEIN 1-like isoform X1 [Notolabrus celidotus]XP_034542282.1 protein ANTAGONIST OF LIKE HETEROCHROMATIN PROTEIN 1-like isoform X2 [Notolabrus celidotus]